MTGVIRSERIGNFDVLVLDSPSNRNALSLRLLHELSEGIAASQVRSSRGLVITHSGTALCSGIDLRERRALGKAGDSHSRLLGELFMTLWNYPKPVVAAVAGAVRGGGMGLLSCSDSVIASPDSTFAYSETRVGLAPALVMAVTLPAVPSRGILPWLLSGETFTAQEALTLGLITVLDDAPRTEGIEKVVAELTAAAPQAQRTVKRLFRAEQDIDMAATIAEMTAESAALFTSAEAHEGMASFAGQHLPAWATASKNPGQ